MHKYKFYLIFFFLITTLAHASIPTTVKIVKKNNDEKSYSSISLTYPIVKNTAQATQANDAISELLRNIVSEYKKNLSDNQPIKAIPSLPLTVGSNTLSTNYKILMLNPNILSIRFLIYTNFYGSAHPTTDFRSLNIDLKKGKILSLADVYSNDYLNNLSAYSKKILTKQLSQKASTPTQPDEEGLKPDLHHFAVWNIVPKGVLITFPPSQVAAYVFGPQEVLIPNTILKRNDF